MVEIKYQTALEQKKIQKAKKKKEKKTSLSSGFISDVKHFGAMAIKEDALCKCWLKIADNPKM